MMRALEIVVLTVLVVALLIVAAASTCVAWGLQMCGPKEDRWGL